MQTDDNMKETGRATCVMERALNVIPTEIHTTATSTWAKLTEKESTPGSMVKSTMENGIWA